MTRTPRRLTTLDRLPVHTEGVIQAVRHHATHGSALQRRLLELGFVPGERIEVLRRTVTGRGPLAVRVGGSTFAMRWLESSLIDVSHA